MSLCVCVDSFPSGVSPGVKTPDFPPTQRHAYGLRFPVNDKKESVEACVSVFVCMCSGTLRITNSVISCLPLGA